MMYMLVWHALFDLDLILYSSLLNVKFLCFGLLFLNYKQYVNFDVWNDCKVYMSDWNVSSDIDLIFTDHWSMLSFPGYVCFLDSICHRATIFDPLNDCKVTCLYGRVYLTLTLFHWSI